MDYQKQAKQDGLKQMNDNLRLFCNFIGLGNPESKIWFVGLEEGGDTITKKNLSQKLLDCLDFPNYFSIDGKSSPVWDYISKIILKVESDDFTKWREYRKGMFQRNNSKFFLSELFPLPKPNLSSWGADYKDIFDFSEKEIYDYQEIVIKYRFPKIKEQWIIAKPDYTICFGKSGWKYFCSLFVLTNEPHEVINSFLVFPQQRIIFTQFLGRWHFSHRKVNELANIIKNLNQRRIK